MQAFACRTTGTTPTNGLMREAGKAEPFSDEVVNELTQALLEDHTTEFAAHLNKVRQSLTNLLDIASVVYKIKRQAYLDI
jgi:hypothetical protein